MQIRESLLTEYLSATAKEPYQISHELIHVAMKFGNVIEKENSVEASGPRTKSHVHFTVKKQFDKFTALYMDVYAEGDSLSETLNVSVHATLASEAPQARGMLTGIFQQQYRNRIYGKTKAHAESLAKKAFMEFQKTVSGAA